MEFFTIFFKKKDNNIKVNNNKEKIKNIKHYIYWNIRFS